MKTIYLTLLAIITLCHSCGPKIISVTTKEFDISDYSLMRSDSLTLEGIDLEEDNFSKILVYKLHHKFPAGSAMVKIGSIEYKDTGFTVDCDYYGLITKAKLEARKNDANIIREIEVKKPKAFVSSCYQLKLELYKYKGDIKSLDLYKETFPLEE